jgi:SAM-dependent methyltransferase
MHMLGIIGRVANGVLEPFGVRVVREGPQTIGGRRLSDRSVIVHARRRGMSPGEFLEEMFGQQGRAEQISRRMIACGALSTNVSTVCEIGAGSGLYIQQVARHVRAARYDIYEIVPSRAQFLARSFGVLAQPTDGETLRATPDRSVDLLHAHGVFVTLDFLTSCSYFREMARVVAPGGHVVFDVITEECLDGPAIDSWLNTRLRYPTLHCREYLMRFFTAHGFALVDEFVMPLLVHGGSRYLIFRRDRGET